MATLAGAGRAQLDLRAIGGGGISETGHVIATTADDEATRRFSRRAAIPSSRASRSSPGRRPAGWHGALSLQLADAGVSIYTCSSAVGDRACSPSSSTIPTGPPDPRAQALILERKC
jgi:hypothetical protein